MHRCQCSRSEDHSPRLGLNNIFEAEGGVEAPDPKPSFVRLGCTLLVIHDANVEIVIGLPIILLLVESLRVVIVSDPCLDQS